MKISQADVLMRPADFLKVLYVDTALIVISKPAGLLAVPGRGPDKQDCAWHRLQAEYADALVVHRLDQATSGLLLFARGKTAQAALSQAFAKRCVTKRYLAVVHGTPQPAQGQITLPLSADWPARPRQRVDPVHGKAAHTGYRLVHSTSVTSQVELTPHTGRTHQLRVHMAAIGHPIVGDALYGPPSHATCLLLHAHMLALAHPLTRQVLQFESPAPF
jgi:tRNA pseudouridine32 synthase / 23S rRNA pseudouridine746 synthase